MISSTAMQQQYDSQKAGLLLKNARLKAKLSLRELAARAATSHSTIAAYEQGRKIPGIDVYIRLLNACGVDLNLVSSPRLHFPEPGERGKELEEVLNLAEQFPARHKSHIQYPRFGHAQSH
jgi:transcriptional regulator with XRE-family HTH domain